MKIFSICSICSYTNTHTCIYAGTHASSALLSNDNIMAHWQTQIFDLAYVMIDRFVCVCTSNRMWCDFNRTPNRSLHIASNRYISHILGMLMTSIPLAALLSARLNPNVLIKWMKEKIALHTETWCMWLCVRVCSIFPNAINFKAKTKCIDMAHSVRWSFSYRSNSFEIWIVITIKTSNKWTNNVYG